MRKNSRIGLHIVKETSYDWKCFSKLTGTQMVHFWKVEPCFCNLIPYKHFPTAVRFLYLYLTSAKYASALKSTKQSTFSQ